MSPCSSSLSSFFLFFFLFFFLCSKHFCDFEGAQGLVRKINCCKLKVTAGSTVRASLISLVAFACAYLPSIITRADAFNRFQYG